LLCFYLDYALRVLTLGHFICIPLLSKYWTVTHHDNEDNDTLVDIDLESEMCEVTS